MHREIDVTGFKVRLRRAHRGNLLWEVGGGEEKCSGSPRGDRELGPDYRRECSGSPEGTGSWGQTVGGSGWRVPSFSRRQFDAPEQPQN